MTANVSTTRTQSRRLLDCGLDPMTADMLWYGNSEFPEVRKVDRRLKDYLPAFSLSRLMELLPFKIQSDRYEFWLDIAPTDYGKQWSIGYYCTEKPRTIKGLTRTESLVECAVQEIEWLSANYYKLNEI